jgi:hypothetical protein
MSICLFQLPSSESCSPRCDDTSLYLIVDDPQETAQTLNDDLVKLHAWSTKWLVNFNPQKTETLTIFLSYHVNMFIPITIVRKL